MTTKPTFLVEFGYAPAPARKSKRQSLKPRRKPRRAANIEIVERAVNFLSTSRKRSQRDWQPSSSRPTTAWRFASRYKSYFHTAYRDDPYLVDKFYKRIKRRLDELKISHR